MNDKGRRLARNMSVGLGIGQWVLAAALLLMVPTTLWALVAPDAVAAAIAEHGGSPIAFRAGVISMAAACVMLGVSLVVAVQLRRMMRTVAAGDPFVAANGARLRVIAGALAVLAATPILLPLLAGTLRWQPGSFDFGLWLGALVALVLAEVFREGARLRDDAELVV